MGLKDKKKKLAQKYLEPVEKDRKLGPSELRKRKRSKESNGDSRKVVQVSIEDNLSRAVIDKKKAKKLRKGEGKKVKSSQDSDAQLDPSNSDYLNELNDEVADRSHFEMQEETGNAEMMLNDDCMSKKARKKKRKDHDSLEGVKSLEKEIEVVQGISKKYQKKKKRDMDSSKGEEEANRDDVYLISEDEGSPKGMKKWIMEYQESRPGLKVLQQRIDEFIITHEARLEQERKEREALSAEEGWQLVTHHKGRKKTKDAESGITVGSVAQAVVESKRAKKKSTDVGLDFYGFHRKEAKRNDIIMLQSKFEQDKKRVQQIRAARKFKPY